MVPNCSSDSTKEVTVCRSFSPDRARRRPDGRLLAQMRRLRFRRKTLQRQRTVRPRTDALNWTPRAAPKRLADDHRAIGLLSARERQVYGTRVLAGKLTRSLPTSCKSAYVPSKSIVPVFLRKWGSAQRSNSPSSWPQAPENQRHKSDRWTCGRFLLQVVSGP